MSPKFIAIIGTIVVLMVVLMNTFFVVTPADQALVLQFGEIRRTAAEPGLYAKIPLIQNVVYVDRRVLDFDPPAKPFILGDKTRLVVDTFTRYRIVDPALFYTAVRSEETFQARLENTVDGALRETFPKTSLPALLSNTRDSVMMTVRSRINDDVKRFGVDVLDVRIRRADLPSENSANVYARMRSEREREAAELRAQGQQQAQEIRSKADRERTIILAEAQRKAEIIRGEGDQQALTVVQQAYEKDPQFYAYYRTLQAYREALTSSDTTFVLSPTGDFFKYFNSPAGR